MKTKSNCRRDHVRRCLTHAAGTADYVGRVSPTVNHVLVEAACRRGVSRQIASTYYTWRLKNPPPPSKPLTREK